MMKNFNIYLPTKKGKVGANLRQILYFESLGNTDYMVLTNNEKIELIMNVEEIEQILWSQGFFRISTNYLINLTLVQVIFPGNAPKVVLDNGKEIFVPQSRRDDLFKALECVYQLNETLY
jgi:DNA-binding LytR/AlgR family response regulator